MPNNFTGFYTALGFRHGKLYQRFFPLVYLLVTSAILYALLSRWAYDDPFITYRYANNLARGLGFVYNPGERILSTTTPLFAMLLGLLHYISSDLPHLANLIGAVSLALGGLFLWDLSRIWNTPIAGWAALLLYPTFTLPAVTIGSETPLYIALCLGAFAFYARQRYYLTAVFAALTILARPDGVLVPIILGVDYLLRIRRPLPWKAVLLFFCLVVPWFAFAWIYFGYPLPATLATKQQQGTMAVSQTFGRGTLSIISWYLDGWQYWVETVLAIAGLYWLVRHARKWSLVVIWTVLYFAAYSLLGVSRYFWYYAPLIPGFIVLVGLGFEAFSHAIHTMCSRAQRSQDEEGFSRAEASQSSNISLCQGLAYLLPLLLLVSLTAAQVVDIWKLKSNLDPRATAYKVVGEWLSENTPEDAVISSLEIGIIGYYADRRMVDFAGILQPEVADKLGSSENYDRAAIWAVENYSPDYVVLVKGDLRTLRQGYLEEYCLLEKHFQSDVVGYAKNINIYTCR
jgi:hypothetical protein